jgi:hypothetical protein
MVYLKSFNESSRINSSKFDEDIINNGRVKEIFTDYEYDIITRTIISSENYNSNLFGKDANYIRRNGFQGSIVVDNHMTNSNICIFKVKDEWYYISINIRKNPNILKQYFYRCDQLDELLSTLKKLKYNL